MIVRDGVCPKCGHATVHSGRDIPVKASSGNTIPIDFQHHAALDNYVCVTCGYVESYISDKTALERIEKQWPDASKTKRKR
jgi:hypothetical protein